MNGAGEQLPIHACASADLITPAVMGVFGPLARELGRTTFRLLLAQAAQDQLEQSCESFGVIADDDRRGALTAWADAMSRVGWGSLRVVELDPVQQRVRIAVADAVESRLQQGLPRPERWGCPLLFGAVIWACSRALGVGCWATETVDADGCTVVFEVLQSDITVAAELEFVRGRVAQDAEEQMLAVVGQKTKELEKARELLRARARDLRQEIQERERAERIKDEVVSVVNHELRTPLTSVRGFAELIRERDLPRETQVRYARIMCTETERLTGLLNNFLDVQRLGSDVYEYAWEAVDVGRLLRDVAEVFSSGSHRIEVDAAPGLPLVRADRQRIHQALANLISNAVKFSPGVPAVFVSATRTQDAVEVCVRDEGIGIPADKIQNLFQMFYRVENGATRSIGGTGLGLCLVKKIVEGHGGLVTVASEPGKGTTFRVALPTAASPAQAS